MHARQQPCLNTISRRTRSQWDTFYKNRYDELNNKNNSHQDSNISNKGFAKKKVIGKKSADSVSVEELDNSTSDDDSETSIDDDYNSDKDYKLNIGKNNIAPNKRTKFRKAASPNKTKALITEEVDLINMLFHSRVKEEKDLIKKTSFLVKKENALISKCSSLPLKFRFEDEETEKTVWEKEIDSLFADLETGLFESEIGCTHSSFMADDDECSSTTISGDIDESPAARCGRGEHDSVVDEQIGIVCRYCSAVLIDIKHVLPPFCAEPPERRQWKYYLEPQDPVMNEIRFDGSDCGNLESCIHSQGTVLDLIPDAGKELYPHQLEGFEFLWRNIAGDIHIDKLESLPADGGTGCIISHAPGTGKTRLTIVFLQTFMKLYPTCRPVIIAPRGMLLTWEQEFKKWNVDIKFHNLNKTKLSGYETATADQTCGHEKNQDYTRLLKLRSWMMGGSILGVSYRLFKVLAGKHDKLKNILVELPGLLVLDEGHNPRTKQSLTWKALTKVKTRRRIMLSGTPFQNNFTELYNTLCLVNPRFSDQIMPPGKRFSRNSGRKRKYNAAREEWANLTSCISANYTSDDANLKKLRSIIEPFVHIHKGDILQKTLRGMRDCLIILKPTDLQTKLLQNIPQANKFLDQVYLASLISVHPSLVANEPEFSDHKRKLNLLKSNRNAGVKTQFLIKLIQLSTTQHHEKVLVFSQFLDPLLHIKNLVEKHFSWKEGRQVIYMDGKQSINDRQRLINSFNDKRSEAKVMLASLKACSEGINLVGASRVVLLDVVWNPSVERQAICRAYRLGQEKAVHVYHLLTSTEVKKYARQAEKERLSELIFCPGRTKTGGVSNEAVEEDEVLEDMVEDQSVATIFDKIVRQPKETKFIDTFGFVDLNQ